MSLDEIEQAIERVQQKDRASFARIVEHFQLRLRVFVASIVASREMVDEIVQTTFVFAYQNIARYEPGTNFYAWLRAIARNYALEELRRETREQKKREQYFEHVISSEILRDEEDGADQYDRAEALGRCVEGVGDEARALLERRYTKQESVQSIAQALGRTVSAVKVGLFRIREALRECIEHRLVQEVQP
jgi:RNA polymerase sigma-70 factor (ECF subfamily)